MEKFLIVVEKEDFVEHVRRICRSNIRRPCKICQVCPFREYVLKIIREQGWKLPPETKNQRR